MADRHTSAAKNLDGLHQEESALDRALRLRDAYNRALQRDDREKTEAEKIAPVPKPPERSVSHAPAPGPHLKPPDGQIRRVVDKQIDEEKQNKLNERARNLNEAYKSADNNNSKDRDHEL